MATLLSWLGVNYNSGGPSTNLNLIFTALVQNDGRTLVKRALCTAATTGSVATDTLTVNQQSRPHYIQSASQQVGASARSITMQGTSNCKGLNFNVSSTTEQSHLSLPRNYEVLINGAWTSVGVAQAITGDPGANAEYQWRITLTMEQNTLAASITEYLAINDIENQATETPGMTHLGTSASVEIVDGNGAALDTINLSYALNSTNDQAYLNVNDDWTLTATDITND